MAAPAFSQRRSEDKRLNPVLTAILGLAIFSLNAIICKRLFFLSFSQRMESIESVYMSISRYAIRHWSDLSWFPLWYTGMPFDRVYQPGFHLAVAALATAAHWPVQVAYHFMTALAYCAGPVTLFALCLGVVHSRPLAFLAALFYSLVSPINFLVPGIRADIGGYFLPRRLHILVEYGEGPHVMALAILPLAVLLLHWAVGERRRWSPLFASMALAAVVVTNWPGSIGLTMAVAAYLLSRIGQRPGIRWLTLSGVVAGAYLLVCTRIPPSTVLMVRENARQSDFATAGSTRALYLAVVLLACWIMHLVLRKARADTWLAFFLYFGLLSGAVVLGYYYFDIRLLPQPWRFQLEVEMAISGVLAYAALQGFRRIANRSVRALTISAAAGLCVFQLRANIAFEKAQIRKIDVENTVEYRMAKAFERLEAGNRVFAPGNVSLWMNMFTDQPQLGGCCDQSIPTAEHRVASFVIYSGMNAGDRDATVSTLWLKAYGAHAVGVTGEHSTEPFKPFAHPEKFRGVLRELWKDGDDAIYEVPQRSASLAHVVTTGDIVRRAPVNGLDTGPLEPYVRALENPAYPEAEFVWINPHEARSKAWLAANQLLSVQITYDSGWRARVNGAERTIASDALGMMVVEPRCAGECVLNLTYEIPAELYWMRGAQIAGVLIGVFLLALAGC